MKKPRSISRSRSSVPGSSDSLDQALNCCANLAALAELLLAYGAPSSPAGLEPKVVSDTAALIAQQVERLRSELNRLNQVAPSKTSFP